MFARMDMLVKMGNVSSNVNKLKYSIQGRITVNVSLGSSDIMEFVNT